MHILIFLALLATAFAHKPVYEPQFLRAYNHFEDEGYNTPLPNEDWDFTNPGDLNALTASYTPQLQRTIPRPYAGAAIDMLLAGHDDEYDVVKQVVFANQTIPFIGMPGVFTCKEHQKVYPSVGLVGPVGVRDAITNQLIFTDSDPNLPFTLPSGYGIKIKHHEKPIKSTWVRPAYQHFPTISASSFAMGFNIECVENYQNPACTADTHFRNNLGPIHINTPGTYYWVVWIPNGMARDKLQDIRLTVGSQDLFSVPGDFIVLGFEERFTGRYQNEHGECSEPNPDRVDMQTHDERRRSNSAPSLNSPSGYSSLDLAELERIGNDPTAIKYF